MDTQKQLHQHISALADGELAEHEVELAFAALATPGGRDAWSVYQQIGEVLRSDACGFELSRSFGAKLAARLATEAAHRSDAVAAADAVNAAVTSVVADADPFEAGRRAASLP